MKRANHFLVCAIFLITLFASSILIESASAKLPEQVDVKRGIVVFIGLPDSNLDEIINLSKSTEITYYYQLTDQKQVRSLREKAEKAGLLGKRIFIDSGSLDSIHLADNLADLIGVDPSVKDQVSEKELLRILRPKGIAWLGGKKLVKPVPEGSDEWTHPYHSPDNNPQSNDKNVKGNFQPQFLGGPMFSPMPEQSVVAGGRIYKAMGHISHKKNQNEMLNKLIGINAYNGTILWKRDLPLGFMMHRNTMIGTDESLFMGDHESCKVFDGQTGKLKREIKIPKGTADGTVWKWMAMQDGILYALVGHQEIKVDTVKSDRRGLGHWPWAMWQGHDYKNRKTAFGFGRNIVAIQPETGNILWNSKTEEYLDSRATCMKNGRIYSYCPEKFITCIDASNGDLIWKSTDKKVLEAIGPNGSAQNPTQGYSTSCYIKCNDDFIFFAGPQRKKLVAVNAKDGTLAWSHPNGNLQLVLRKNGIYGAGPKSDGILLDYKTGQKLSSLPTRRACTRATGCEDSIFYRTRGGTMRILTDGNKAEHIAPMRPPCQDGVLVSNGLLYWGPWMCGCELSLYGNISLAPDNSPKKTTAEIYQNALTVTNDPNNIQPLKVHANDWPDYRGNNSRSNSTPGNIPDKVSLKWEIDITSDTLPTAPVTAGGMVFVADRNGAISAFDSDGKLAWKSYTSGPIYYSPSVRHDRVYAGSADGRVYAFEAKTGKQLWTFRVAPEDRWIPVYGKLISRWPVAGGLVVENNTVYAAAGITHFGGTYVVALDAITGKLKASNSTSGTVSSDVNNGISLQGNMKIVNNELQFLAGGVYETARYDLKTLKCLNEPKSRLTSTHHTAFYPLYPEYGKYVSLEHSFENGSTICFDASYEGSIFNNLALQPKLPEGVTRGNKEASKWYYIRRGKKNIIPDDIWKDKTDRRFTSFIVADKQDRLLAAGHPDEKPEESFLTAINIKDGSDLWTQSLPSVAVKGGTAINHQGEIFVSLENGKLLCYEPVTK